jgi:hypothetical protein
MNIRLGIYDIFSKIVPGSFYMLAILQLTVVLGLIKFDWTLLKDIGIIPSIGLAIVAYIFGSALHPFGSAWLRIFRKRGKREQILQEFKDKHSDRWIFDFEDSDFSTLRAYVGIHNPDMAGDIERDNALCIMLRDISFGIVILAICEIIQFVNTLDWVHVISLLFLLFLSYQTAIRARNLRDLFNRNILETIIAYRLNLEERVKPTNKKRLSK